jgi:hypothetical protein
MNDPVLFKISMTKTERCIRDVSHRFCLTKKFNQKQANMLNAQVPKRRKQ